MTDKKKLVKAFSVLRGSGFKTSTKVSIEFFDGSSLPAVSYTKEEAKKFDSDGNILPRKNLKVSYSFGKEEDLYKCIDKVVQVFQDQGLKACFNLEKSAWILIKG